MVLSQVILGIDIISIILLLATLVFLVKNREFERLEVENTMNVLIFGIFFIFLATLIDTSVYLNSSFSGIFASLGDVSTYIRYLTLISEVALIPLFAVCFFVGIFLARDYLQGFPIKKEEEDKIKIIK